MASEACSGRFLSVVVGCFGCYVTCPNAVSSRVIHLVFHRYQHNCSSSLDSIKLVYQHPLERPSAATDISILATAPNPLSVTLFCPKAGRVWKDSKGSLAASRYASLRDTVDTLNICCSRASSFEEPLYLCTV
jgi:hypothetical protein